MANRQRSLLNEFTQVDQGVDPAIGLLIWITAPVGPERPDSVLDALSKALKVGEIRVLSAISKVNEPDHRRRADISGGRRHTSPSKNRYIHPSRCRLKFCTAASALKGVPS